ncbi:sulfatase-like hydrolase/transferase [Cribrihabitans pelagius]|uniref:sulfatase-like hydrolase/transferase n=1 Tax=Cribrihabitans pelagius TaxID=1765746 RepID=UPI003B5B229C
MNILYIMFDQLRFDYLSCAGHPYLRTPHIDALAARGVRFSRAYVQSPTCGSSRMSSYTGRYPSSHGVQFNGYPLRVGEWTMGDHLRKAGMGCHLIGKTHMAADAEGMARLGLAPDSLIGVRQAECGFDPFVRDDGLWAEGPDGFYDPGRSPYNEYLKAKGYPGENPWADFANAGAVDGDIASGWFMVNADKPANIAEEDSETPWLTTQAMDFISQSESPWCAHLSYIKPHWPYIVPAPYHDMYGPEHVLPAQRSERERQGPHPVFAGMMDNPIGRAFSREEVRQKVIPAYMGLIKQADDQMGRLFAWLEETGRMQDTMIVLTSDHGDYLGDHWLGEKNLFHEVSVKVPLIVYDPRPEADVTRGTVCDALVEAIDLLPTFLEAAGGEPASHILEGRSLMPLIRGERPEWREFAVSEFDYSTMPLCAMLGLAPKDARLFMVADKRWKFMHAEGGLRPMLFDLEKDPGELEDLGASAAHRGVIALMYERLRAWGLRMSQRITLPDAEIIARRGASDRKGILLGVYKPEELDPELTAKYRGPVPRR